MSLVADFAWSHPDPHALAAARYVGVARYLSHDPSKDISPAERDATLAAGLGIVLVVETTANRWQGGFAAGQADAQEFIARAQALGMPSGCALYWAPVDMDSGPDAADEYMRGVNSVPTPYVNGIYGSAGVVASIRAANQAWYFWQTCAWSHDVVDQQAHLYQRAGHTVHVDGAADSDYDENAVMRPDGQYGAWLPSGQPLPTPAPAPAPVTPPAPTGVPETVQLGDKGQGPRNVQAMMLAAGRQIVVDSDFGPATKAVVAEWQAAVGLVADGIVGPATWGKLMGSCPLLVQGATGQYPRNLQALLLANGEPCGPGPAFGIDGVDGPDTTGHLTAWQARAQLAADGRCGPQSWGHLFGVPA